MPSSTVTRTASLSVAVLLLFGMVACSDDDGGDDVQAYCDFSASLDQVGEPTSEQYDEIASLAPSEISDQVELVVDDLNEADSDAEDVPDFGDDFLDSLDDIEAFEAENCGDGGTTADTSDDTSDDTTESIGGTVTTEE
jgi:hypothetical protein